LSAMKLAPVGAPRRAASNFGPAVVGVLKPLLVVPADFEQRFSPPEQALVLAHEHEHLAAGHTRINAALIVLTSLNWFNPLVHWAARLARADQELACDAAVLERFPRERGVYAEALLKAHIAPALLPLGCTWPSRSSSFLKERMTMLATKTPGRTRRMAGVGFIAVALLGAGLAAWAQKPVLPIFAGATAEVDKDGRVLWNGKPVVDNDALIAQARNQIASGIPHLRLSVDPKTRYMYAGRVIEAAQRQGMEDIMFLPSGTILRTPKPPAPGSNVPAPPVPSSQPPAATQRPAPPAAGTNYPDPIRLFVDFDDTLFWNGKAVDTSVVERNLKDAAAQQIPPEVHIEPHKQASYARVEQLVGIVNKIGLTKIGVIGGT
jgi:biopolymer transport protein ExbD